MACDDPSHQSLLKLGTITPFMGSVYTPAFYIHGYNPPQIENSQKEVIRSVENMYRFFPYIAQHGTRYYYKASGDDAKYTGGC